MIFPIYSFWIPQILYCVYHEARQPLRPLYVVGMTLTRLALPLYMLGCPHNVLRLQSNPGICIGLCLGMGLQVRPVPLAAGLTPHLSKHWLLCCARIAACLLRATGPDRRVCHGCAGLALPSSRAEFQAGQSRKVRQVLAACLIASGCAGGAAAGADQVGAEVLHPQAVPACQVRLSPQSLGTTA